jgi:hypothetical protein
MCRWLREKSAPWRIGSHLVVTRRACLALLVSPPGAATASHSIQRERLVSCL